MNTTQITKVDLVTQVTGNGRHIRKGTRVVFADGREVVFGERLPKGVAIAQALKVVARQPV